MSVHRIESPIHAPLAPLCKPDARDTLLDRLCEVAHALPDAIAISGMSADGVTDTVTFDELLHRTYALARKIAHLMPGETHPIAVDADCSVESMTLMLAVMASGHSLVPLDSNLPDNRAARIIEAASAVRVSSADLADAEDSAVPLASFTGNRTALITFTSGSTGAAKGVLLSHRMCLTKAYEVSAALDLTTRDRVGNALPVSFGAGLNTVMAGLLSGASVHCIDPRSTTPTALTEWIEQSSLTTLHCSPSLVRSFPATGAVPVVSLPDNAVPTLRLVTTYGEALHSRDVVAFRSALGTGASFVNWYATTEAGAVAYEEYRSDRPLPSGFLSAGTLPRGKLVEVVDPSGRTVPHGTVGEIRVSAECMSDGYLGQHDLTRARFTISGGVHRYSTGDLGRFDADGRLRLIGRADDAIKVRGYLVEPAEVEAALRSIEGVSDCTVVARVNDADAVQLEAFFVADDVSIEHVRERLRAELPHWMVPAHLGKLGRIARNERGKVDRSKLPSASESAPVTPDPGAVTLTGVTELAVGTLVARALDVSAIDRKTDFAELGATSLVLTQILVGLQQAFHVRLAISDLAGTMNVADLSALVDRTLAAADGYGHQRARESIVVPLRTEGSRTPLFVVAGAGVPAVGLIPLANRVASDRPVYAIQAKGLDSRAFPDRSIEGAARRYVRELRRVQPHGPYLLAGHSLGGWIALEMAHVLERQGEIVDRLVLLDPRLFRRVLSSLPGGTGHLEAAPDEVRLSHSKPTLRELIRHNFSLAAAGIVRMPTTQRWLAFGVIGALALGKHTPTPWGGRATVIVTADNTPNRESWKALLTGDITVYEVDGRHVDMVREPVVARVGEIVDAGLTEGRRRPVSFAREGRRA